MTAVRKGKQGFESQCITAVDPGIVLSMNFWGIMIYQIGTNS